MKSQAAANIWVTNGSSKNVNKLQASNGTLLELSAWEGGVVSYGVAFDGATIWVASYGGSSSRVTKATFDHTIPQAIVSIEDS